MITSYMNKIEVYNRSGNLSAKKKGTEIPVVLYGKINNENLNFSASITPEQVDKLITSFGKRIFSVLIYVEFDKKEFKCLIKDIQFHPISEKVVHIDFQILNNKQDVIVPVAINILNSSQAPFHKEGGILFTPQRRVNIKCNSDNIPEYINCDVSTLHKGDKINTTDIDNIHFCKKHTLVTILDK